MFARILIKDLRHKRGINFIIFLFMLLAIIFVASSVNNIIIVSNGMKYCMEKGKVGDLYVSVYESPGEFTLEDLLNENKDYYESFSKNEGIILEDNNIKGFKGQDGREFDCSASILLQPQWHDNMLMFDQNGEIATLSDGEIAMQQSIMDKNNLVPGDTFELCLNDQIFELKVVEAIKDPAFGGDFIGLTRFLVSDQMYREIRDTKAQVNYSYNIDTKDSDQLNKKINQESFQIFVSGEKSMFASSYAMSMILAISLIVVGVCLIIIAFLILRFTIVVTLSEDYKQIGVMKAIGIENRMIRNIYLTKYLAIVCVAAVLGCFISIPVSNFMLDSVSKNMMLEDASVNFGINVVCSIFVAVLVLLTCYLCTRRLRKVSVIDVIRNGQNGERFAKRSKLSLHKRGFHKTIVFLAMNDILSNVRRYVVLILTFTIGMLVVILPLNIIATMTSDEMGKCFMLDPKADFYIPAACVEERVSLYGEKGDPKALEKSIQELKKEFIKKGYDLSLEALTFYMLPFYTQNKEDACQEMCMVPMSHEQYQLALLEGDEPIEANEVALSMKAKEKLQVVIGDTVHVCIDHKIREMIVTGFYQSYIQMGNSVYLSQKFDTENMKTSGAWVIQCYLKNMKYSKDRLEQLRNDFPDLTFYTMQEAMDTQMGNSSKYIQNLKYLIVVIISIVNLLITVLMIKIFILGEKGQIAMLRSVGFSIRGVRLWQAVRFLIIMVISAVLGILVSMPMNHIVVKPVFGFMGATQMKIVTNQLEIYVIYPLLLFVIVGIAAYCTSRNIKKINLMEINNQE